MKNSTTIIFIRFLLLISLQIFVLNNIYFGGFINPYLYILFILLLPFETSGWLLLLLAFILGMIIDVASNIIGYHTIATVLMAYIRYHLLRLIAPRDGYSTGMQPSLHSLGIPWFFKYTLILTLTHHLALFWIESFRLSDLIHATTHALASAAFTILLIFIMQFLTIQRK